MNEPPEADAPAGSDPISIAVGRPHSVAVGVIIVVIFSVLALKRIPIQLKPNVDVPKITVTTPFRGASAVEVEEQVTRELEEVLQSVEGLTELTSESAEGRSAITLELQHGTNTRLAIVDVVNKLSQVPRLPEEADEPEVAIATSGGTNAVMWIAVLSRYEPELARRIIDDDVESRLERVPGVSDLLIVGGSEREVQIRFEPELLIARGVTVSDLTRAIGRGNLNVRGGTVETDTRSVVVRTVGRAPVASELEDIVVKEFEGGGSVLLGDLAVIRDSHREKTGFVNIDGNPGVAIGVLRQTGANVVDLIERVDVVCDELNDAFSDRGIDVHLRPVYRETTYINAALQFVVGNLLLGAGLAVIVLIVFLRSLRSVLIVGLAIPISLVAVFLVLAVLGRTLNVISLAGLAFAAGMVVDNAIVVLENVFRHLEMGKGRLRAAIDGGREVWGGVLASTLTTIAVFVPILLESDEASQLFTDIALAISAAVAFSLVVALTVVPVGASLLFGAKARPGGGAPAGGPDDEEIPLGPVGRGYARFTTLLGRTGREAVAAKVGFVLLVLAASLGTLKLMPPAEYLPTGNRNLVLFFASPIPGTRPETIADGFEPWERWVLEQPESDRMFTVSGERFNGGGVILKDEYSDAASIAAFHGKMFAPGSQLPGFRFFVPVRSSLFDDPGKQFEVELSGPDFEVLTRASQTLAQRIQAVPGVQFVRSSLVTGRPELRVRVDEGRAKDLGLDVAEIGTIVETFVAGRRLTQMIDGGREVDVNLLAPQTRIGSREDLLAVRFLAAEGRPIALAEVAEVTATTGPQSIRRLERERNVLLTVNIAETHPLETAVRDVEETVFPAMYAELGPAYALGVGGSADKLRTTLGALSGGLLLSVIIIYLLLVSLFRSFGTPIIILVTVPLALSGGLVGIRAAHELSGGQAAFDVIAMLGFVILAGLVVNNAILIVHQANNFRAEGLTARRALAASARSRLRPILMTVVTTVTAMLPLAAGGGAGAELYQGLGAVIVGGLVVSTVFTLFLVPVLLSLGQDLLGEPAEREAEGARGSEGPGATAGAGDSKTPRPR